MFLARYNKGFYKTYMEKGIVGYEQLKNILDSNREQEELEKQEAMNPAKCPVCNYPLEVNKEGELACPICGWFRR